MFNFLKPKVTTTLTTHLPTCLHKDDRVLRYDGPVQKMLAAEGLGAVVSGTTTLNAEGRGTASQVVFTVTGLDGRLLDRLVAHFDSLGAPKGSWFTDAEGKELRRFGTTEVVVMELDPAVLPAGQSAAQVAATLMGPIEERVSSAGRLQGTATYPAAVELYFHCRSPRIVEAALAELLAHHPLCRNARVYRMAVDA